MMMMMTIICFYVVTTITIKKPVTKKGMHLPFKKIMKIERKGKEKFLKTLKFYLRALNIRYLCIPSLL
jgi:hypothetical protein